MGGLQEKRLVNEDWMMCHWVIGDNEAQLDAPHDVEAGDRSSVKLQDDVVTRITPYNSRAGDILIGNVQWRDMIVYV